MEKVLRELGFSSKETKLYLALLQLGEETVFELAKKAQVKRTTAYSVLEGLKEKGIVSRRQAKKAALYSAVEPERLLEVYQKRVEGFKEILPELKALKKDNSKRPKIQVFEGRGAVKNVYYEVIATLKKGQEVLFFATFEHVYPDLEQSLEEFKITLKENPGTTKAREILNFGTKERKYAESMQGLANYKIKFIPREFDAIHMDFIIFGEKVALVQTEKEIFATVLQSQPLAAALRTLFEMAWRQAVSSG